MGLNGNHSQVPELLAKTNGQIKRQIEALVVTIVKIFFRVAYLTKDVLQKMRKRYELQIIL